MNTFQLSFRVLTVGMLLWPATATGADCNNLTPVLGDDGSQIQACLNSVPLTILANTGQAFDIETTVTIPAGKRLAGSNGYPTVRAATNWDADKNYLIEMHANSELSFLTLDADHRITKLNSAVISPAGDGVSIHDAFIRNNDFVGGGTQSVGVHIWKGLKGIELLRVQLHDNFFGVTFHGGTAKPSNPADANRIVDSLIYNNKCGGVALLGYGEVRGSSAQSKTLIYGNGFFCANPVPPCHPVHVPGPGVWAPGNRDGFLLQYTEIRDNCGHNVDMDGVSNAVIRDSFLDAPGTISDPSCKGGASIGMLDCDHNIIQDNVIVNNTTFVNWAASPSCFDSNGCFGPLRAQPTKKWGFGLWLCAGDGTSQASHTNMIINNQIRAECASYEPDCVGVGYYLSPGTGLAPAPICGGPNEVEANISFGSNAGSVRCGMNVYAENDDDVAHPVNPDAICAQ